MDTYLCNLSPWGVNNTPGYSIPEPRRVRGMSRWVPKTKLKKPHRRWLQIANEMQRYQAAMRTLARTCPRRAPGMPIADFVMEVVQQHTFVTIEQLKGNCRLREFVLARNIYYYAMKRRAPGFSLTAISGAINKSHSTLIHGLQALQSEMEASNTIKQLVDSVCRQVRGE